MYRRTMASDNPEVISVDKSRKVLWITEVDDYEAGEIRLNTLYRFEEGKLRKKGELKNREKLIMAGESI